MRAFFSPPLGSQQNIYGNNSSSQGEVLWPYFDQQLLQTTLCMCMMSFNSPTNTIPVRNIVGMRFVSQWAFSSFHPLLLLEPTPPSLSCCWYFSTASWFTDTLEPLKELSRGIKPWALLQGRSASRAACWISASPPATFTGVFADVCVLGGKFILKSEIH